MVHNPHEVEVRITYQQITNLVQSYHLLSNIQPCNLLVVLPYYSVQLARLG